MTGVQVLVSHSFQKYLQCKVSSDGHFWFVVNSRPASFPAPEGTRYNYDIATAAARAWDSLEEHENVMDIFPPLIRFVRAHGRR